MYEWNKEKKKKWEIPVESQWLGWMGMEKVGESTFGQLLKGGEIRGIGEDKSSGSMRTVIEI